MIDISGRATRAGTRGIAMLAAVAAFAVPQLAYEGVARAAGSGDPVGHRHRHGVARHDHRKKHHSRVDVRTRAPHGRIVPGRTYKWPYSVTNNGTRPVKHVTFATTPDRDLKVVTTPPKCRWHGKAVLVCRVGLIPRGVTKHGSITAKVNPKAHVGKSLSSPARLSWQSVPAAARVASPADVRTRATAFPPVTVAPTTDLAVSSTAPEQVGSSDAPYEISVTNDGPVTAESVVVRAAVAPANGRCGSRTGSCAAAQRLSNPACGTGSCGSPDHGSCGCLSGRPVREVARESRPDRHAASCAGQSRCGSAANGSCARCSAGRPADHPAAERERSGRPASDRPGNSCRQACEDRSRGCGCGTAPALPNGPVTGVAAHARGGTAGAPPVSIRHHRRCVARGTGFVCALGAIPPGRTRTLRLAVHGRPGPRGHRFRCLSTVRSGTPDSNTANNRSACHTRRARPVAARVGAPAPHLPRTGGSFGLMALWGLGLSGAGLALVGLGRWRRRGARG